MFRDDVNMYSRREVLAYSAEMRAIAENPLTADKDAYRGLADDLTYLAEGLPDDTCHTPENLPQEAVPAPAAPEAP